MLAGVAVLALTAAACGDDADTGSAQGDGAPFETHYVGAVEGSDAYIAIISSGSEVAGYLCDSEQVDTYFGKAELSEGVADLTDRDGAQIGSVTIADGAATGEIDVAGEELSFTAEAAAGEAGFYWEVDREDDEPVAETGWVVLADGTFRGIRRDFGGGLSAAANLPVGQPWIDPDPDPIRLTPWTDPDPQP